MNERKPDDEACSTEPNADHPDEIPDHPCSPTRSGGFMPAWLGFRVLVIDYEISLNPHWHRARVMTSPSKDLALIGAPLKAS